jgi:5'(3')-deoxyribonucleotidase
MVIKIDMDGVIRNIFDEMCTIYNNVFGTHLCVDDIFDYDVDAVFTKIKENIGISAADYFFKLYAYRLFYESNPYDGVKKAVEKLRDEGHKVVIVTWQYTLDNKLNTLRFLDRHNIPYDDICFTRDKWMIQGDWLIDDNPEFIEDERDKSKKILINMPYNKNMGIKAERADNLMKAVDIVLEYDERQKEMTAPSPHEVVHYDDIRDAFTNGFIDYND